MSDGRIGIVGNIGFADIIGNHVAFFIEFNDVGFHLIRLVRIHGGILWMSGFSWYN